MIKQAVKMSLALLVFISASIAMLPSDVGAVDARNFNAGRIIDDAVFTNANSMTIPEIQTFLNSKVSCDTWGTKRSELGGGTRAQWMASRGISPPFRCITDYFENVSTGESNYSKSSNPAGSVSAAEIIYRYSREFNINPQVILATLQKENGLITDEWPTPKQYSEAMGFGCPDNVAPNTPACNPSYGSFSTQVYQAARHFRGYIDNRPGWWIPFNTGWNQIMWNVSSTGCGSGPVLIENRATVALYSYTPYQPNEAAKNAQFGTGDRCSAYGNRNFFLYFTEWFGSTHRQPYSWNRLDTVVYKDASMRERVADSSTLRAGDRLYVTVVAQNTGIETWRNYGANPTRIGTANPNDRVSTFCNEGWVDCSRPATMTQREVRTGEIATFGFWVTAPSSAGLYTERYNLVTDGVTWMQFGEFSNTFNVIDSYKWNVTSVKYYSDPQRTVEVQNDSLIANTRYYASVSVKNTGNTVWTNLDSQPVRLATGGQAKDKGSPLCYDDWVVCSRLSRANEATIGPNAIATFNFTIDTGSTLGYFGQEVEVVQDAVRWYDSSYTIWMRVNPANYRWSYQGTKYYTDSTMSTETGLDRLQTGQSVFVVLSAKNDSNTSWYSTGKYPVRLGTFGPIDRSSALFHNSWVKYNRPAALKQSEVRPGEIGTFEFTMSSPSNSGKYNEYFNILVESRAWMNDLSLLYKVQR